MLINILQHKKQTLPQQYNIFFGSTEVMQPLLVTKYIHKPRLNQIQTIPQR